MKAVSYAGVRRGSVSEHPKPKLKNPTDALLRVTPAVSAAAIFICTTDGRR